MSERIRRLLGCIALTLACVMIGAAMTQTLTTPANAETLQTGEVVTVVHTSPFTQAIAQVRDSVVGVSNYQVVTYGGYSFGYGFGYGYGYGDRNQPSQGREELASTGSGVVIGETTEIGDNCTLYQGVTLGGTGKDVGKRHPTLGNNVMVGAGAKVLGPLKVGDNSKIAANAVVLHEVPENCTAVGIPAKVVRRGGVKIQNEQLDHVHIPDPVAQEFARMERTIEELRAEIADLKEKQK